MNKTFISKFSELESELKQITQNGIEDAIIALAMVSKCIIDLDEALAVESFISKEEEILYFKNQIPQVYKYLSFYKTIINLENERNLRYMSKEEEIEFYDRVSRELMNVDRSDLIIVEYMHNNHTYLDKKFFLMKNANWRTANLYTSYFFNTKTFNTVSFIIGKKQAIDLIINYIDVKKKGLNGTDYKFNSSLQWTSSKVNLIELGYSLYKSKAINEGKAELGEIMGTIGYLFNNDLGNYHSQIQDIKYRRLNSTKFLDHLKDNLLMEIDEK